MSDVRPLYFELHIRPLFRLLDRHNMLSPDVLGDRAFDLYAYEQVRARLGMIAERLREEPRDVMPPPRYGGPWPEEWIALFERWVREGCLRLDVPAARWNASRREGIVRVEAIGETADKNDAVWLDLVSVAPREYIVYREPRGSGPPAPFKAIDEFRDDAVRSVWITDAEGRRELPIS